MDKTWVLVANSSSAVLYNQKHRNELEMIETLKHDESKLKKKELSSDKPGRVSNQFSTKGKSLNFHSDPHKVELEGFAKEISDFLERARKEGDFDKIIISSSPKFLGILNNKMSKKTKNNVSKYIGKDLSQFSKNELQEYLAA